MLCMSCEMMVLPGRQRRPKTSRPREFPTLWFSILSCQRQTDGPLTLKQLQQLLFLPTCRFMTFRRVKREGISSVSIHCFYWFEEITIFIIFKTTAVYFCPSGLLLEEKEARPNHTMFHDSCFPHCCSSCLPHNGSLLRAQAEPSPTDVTLIRLHTRTYASNHLCSLESSCYT